MTGGRSRPKKPRARARTARRPSRRARPALGNDPFARGAAARAESRPDREPAAPPIEPPAPPSPPGSPSGTDGQTDRVKAVEQRVAAALDGVEERLVDLAERAGLREASHELGQTVSSLLPRLRAGLGSALDLLRLLEPADQLDRFGMDARFVERFAPVAELLYRAWWRTTVREVARVPATGPAIIVANHAGLVPWDALVLRLALQLDHPARRELRPLLDERECSLALVGSIAVRLGAVRSSPEAAEAVLADGKLVGVFPEGSAGARKPWRERYRLQRFGRGGFVKLALRTRAPIIPCAIVGSEEASPGISRAGWLAERLGVPLIGKGAALRFGPAALLPLPSRWSLHFGAAIAVDDHPASQAGDPAAVNALTERVRSALQALLDEDLAARGSVFL